MKQLTAFAPDIIHSHCPMASTFLCRELRELTGAPLILTYHTKFDLDIQRLIKTKKLQELAVSQMIKNISACDEIWAVNRGAGENLKSLGYKGDYVVMKNGVDFENSPPTELELALINKELNLPTDSTPVFLFVERVLWYKGIKIILDSLRELKTMGHDFKMIFVGKGQDEPDIKAYAESIGLAENCIFAGPIYDRAKLKTVYGRADMLFLPSVFDNDPLVVKEAAAAHTVSLLIKDSSSADGVTHMTDGVLIEENAASMTQNMLPFFENPTLWRTMGETASQNLYLSWEDSVAKAAKQYEEVLKRVPKSRSTTHPKASYDSIIRMISMLHRRKKRMCKACKKKKMKAKKNK
jgi:glycosyltransferase involved in cell wall biosynthesis